MKHKPKSNSRGPSRNSDNFRGGGQWDQKPNFRKDRPQEKRGAGDGGSLWIWGTHAVDAAIANPKRDIIEILATKNAIAHLPKDIKAKTIEPESLTDILPPNAVHQGVAARVKPLPDPDYDEVLSHGGFIFVLDQLTDPQNIGSIFRTAAAFGAKAIIQQDRKAPSITGVIAKAAQGGIEIVPDLRVVNISQTIKELSDSGWFAIGLDMEGSAGSLAKLVEGEKRPIAIVLGAEGKGLRQLVSERCDAIAHIPMGGNMESLNVSNAAAIAAYEICRK